MTFHLHHSRLRIVHGRAAAGARLGRLRPEQPEKPPAADLAFDRAPRPERHTRVLVDTSPDLREQLLDANVDWLDGVLMTHEHADHCHGIDDLRPLFVRKRRRLDMYLSEAASRVIRPRFELLLREAARAANIRRW